MVMALSLVEHLEGITCFWQIWWEYEDHGQVDLVRVQVSEFNSMKKPNFSLEKRAMEKKWMHQLRLPDGSIIRDNKEMQSHALRFLRRSLSGWDGGLSWGAAARASMPWRTGYKGLSKPPSLTELTVAVQTPLPYWTNCSSPGTKYG